MLLRAIVTILILVVVPGIILHFKRKGSKEEREKMKLITDPIIKLINNFNSEKAGTDVAKNTIDICNKIKNKTITPKEGDLFYSLLFEDINMDNKFLSKEIKDLILSGCTLHKYGTKHGPDLDLMEQTAGNYLKDKHNA